MCVATSGGRLDETCIWIEGKREKVGAAFGVALKQTGVEGGWHQSCAWPP